MILTNQKIYDAAIQLQSFQIEGKLPVRINFFLQKNIQTIVSAGKEVEAARADIVKSFGILNETGTQYHVPMDKVPAAQKELDDLFKLEQDLNIHIFSLDEFDGIELTTEQLSSIIFMIEE